MIKRFFAIALILFIIVFQVDQAKKQADAFVVVPIVAISYIATAMVAAGAVGYFTKDADGNWGGNLYTAAKAHYDVMADNMKNSLNTALAVSSFVTMSAVPGLWDFLHGEFLTSSLIPTTQIQATTTLMNGQETSAIAIGQTFTVLLPDTDSTTYRNIGIQIYNSTGVFRGGLGLTVLAGTTLYNARDVLDPNLLKFYDDAALTHSVGSLYDGSISYFTVKNDGIPLYTVVLSGLGLATYAISDGDSSRTINPPADPAALNQANSTTTYTDRNGVSTTSIPDTQTKTDTGTIDSDRAASAAAASAAAIAAALALGYSQAAADAAGVAASNAIYAGQTAAAAASAGAVAATAYTGALTTDIATTKPGDALDFSKLKFAANLFTNKFPFSLPWDLKAMVTSFGSGSVTAPVIAVELMGLPVNINLAMMDSLAAAARILELFAFNVALVVGTRKFVGGDS